MKFSFFRKLSLVALPLLAMAASSCTASLDLERFKRTDSAIQTPGGQLTNLDFFFEAKSMQSHVNEYFEIRIVDNANRVKAKLIYADVTGPDFSLFAKGVIPKTNGPQRIDFWADHNNSFKYDGVEGAIDAKDHAWRRVLDAELDPDTTLVSEQRYELRFLHNTDFVDIFTDLNGGPISGADTLLNFNLKVSGVAVGQMFEVRVVEKDTGRLVGLYRKGRAQEAFNAQILGILDEETTYEISAFTDANGDGKFTAGEPSWKQDITSTSAGIEQDFNAAALPQTPISTGEPGTP